MSISNELFCHKNTGVAQGVARPPPPHPLISKEEKKKKEKEKWENGLEKRQKKF